MSRPFSYHDENFTVIDSLLICHIFLNERTPYNEPIVEIPPAIFNHMLFYNNIGYMVFDILNSAGGYSFYTGVKEIDNKHYLIASVTMDNMTYKYLYTCYPLKDI